MAAEYVGSNLFLLSQDECESGDQLVYVFRYAGNIDALGPDVFNKGGIWTVDGVSYKILKSRIVREAGSTGTVTVECVPYRGAASQGVEPYPGDPLTEHIEIAFVETAQPLAFHKDFPKEEVEAWQKFIASPESVRLAGKYRENPDAETSEVDLPEELGEWAELYNKGLATFRIWLPVVTRVRTYETTPQTLICEDETPGHISPPPISLDGFSGESKWLKTGDNVVQESGSGRWTRTEVWTYAEEWPDLLYS